MKLGRMMVVSAALLIAFPASAVTYVLGTIDSGPVDLSAQYQPGYTLVNFDNGTSPFVGGGVVSGTIQNEYVEPAGDITPYFAVGPITSNAASLGLSGINQLSFYWGSLDTYNTITFDGLNQTFSGSVFGGTNSTVYRPSREVTFNLTGAESAALTGITLKSNTNAFELDNLIYGSAVPELGTWAMMVVGFGAVGLTLRRRNSPRPELS